VGGGVAGRALSRGIPACGWTGWVYFRTVSRLDFPCLSGGDVCIPGVGYGFRGGVREV
jgi:hypothetical protein